MEQNLRIKNLEISDIDIERFFSKFSKTDGCWTWNGTKLKNGYGVFRLRKKSVLAHRLSKLIHTGSLSDELTIDHICCVRSCVNPFHMEEVSLKENFRRGYIRWIERGGVAGGPASNPNKLKIGGTCRRGLHVIRFEGRCSECLSTAMDYIWDDGDLDDLDRKFDALAEYLGVEFVFERISDGSDVADKSRWYARAELKDPVSTPIAPTKQETIAAQVVPEKTESEYHGEEPPQYEKPRKYKKGYDL